MATRYVLKHACGHQETHYIARGKKEQRDRYAESLAERECQECWTAKQNQKAAEASEEQNLPQLTGTEKQVAWATSIRLSFINLLQTAIEKTNRIIDDSQVDRMREHLAKALTKTKAEYWIDNRFAIDRDKERLNDAIKFANEVVKEMEEGM